MGDALRAYVEKHLLSARSKINIDDDGNEETRARVSAKIVGDEGVEGIPLTSSKLRAQNVSALAERDPKYKTKKVSRKDTNLGIDNFKLNPRLANLFDDDDAEDSMDGSSSDEIATEKKKLKKEKKHKRSTKSKISIRPMELDDSEVQSDYDSEFDFVEEDGSENYSADEDGDEKDSADTDSSEKDSVDTDRSEKDSVEEDGSEKDSVEEDGSESDYDGEDSENDVRKDSAASANIKTFSREETDHTQRGLAVKNQCTIYKNLFDGRVSLQCINALSNQLPQHDTFKLFLMQNDSAYSDNLLTARKAAKKLVSQLIKLQEVLLLQNTTTANILEEPSNESNLDHEEAGISKKKRKLAELGNLLNKRHKSFTPYRDTTLADWHQKSQLLSVQSRGGFDGFDISAALQVENMLSNREPLLKKTRLVAFSRRNTYKILGKSELNQQKTTNSQHYDSEIFDDTDFYSRLMEEEWKFSGSYLTSASDIAEEKLGIRTMRTSKRRTGGRSNKGRHLNFDEIVPLCGFMAPCKPATITDEAMTNLFSSLFSST